MRAVTPSYHGLLALLTPIFGALVACSSPPARESAQESAVGDTSGRASRMASPATYAAKSPAERGRYLVGFGSCDDCHTPKVLTDSGPVLDMGRRLSGHRADEKIPAIPAGAVGRGQWGALGSTGFTAWAGPWGVSYAANLTPDATGTRGWTADQFIRTMRTGRHFGVGRRLLPPMPWFSLNNLTDDDLRSVFAYLQSLPPVQNRVPLPVAPTAQVTSR